MTAQRDVRPVSSIQAAVAASLPRTAVGSRSLAGKLIRLIHHTVNSTLFVPNLCTGLGASAVGWKMLRSGRRSEGSFTQEEVDEEKEKKQTNHWDKRN